MPVRVAAGVVLVGAFGLTSCGDLPSEVPADPSSGRPPGDGPGATDASSAGAPPDAAGTDDDGASGGPPPPGPSDDSTGDADPGGIETTGPPPSVPGDGEPGTVRFVAFGDSGEGNGAQIMVANAAELVCADRGCDFAMLLGDNFYDTGVGSVADTQFIDKFEVIYEGLDMPFYVVLGNHDYGQFANNWARGTYQVQYSVFSDKWTMPHFWYTFWSESGATQFFAFDTARMMWNHDVGDQRQWMSEQLAQSTAPWKIAFAHHPYLSNGQHGNAGRYEGLPGLPIISGVPVEEFIDDLVCGQVQVYLSGHDHNRQVFDPVCGTYFFVSGAAAKTDGFANRDPNPTRWGDDTREGFLWIQIEGVDLTAAFYDLDGNLDHELSASL